MNTSLKLTAIPVTPALISEVMKQNRINLSFKIHTSRTLQKFNFNEVSKTLQ